jgi:hypothetical protein
MVKLLVVLVAAIGVVYGGLAVMGRGGQGPAAQGGLGGPPQARAVVQDYGRIERGNRAALERTITSAAEPR